MPIGDIRDNKLMSLAAHGYTPFQPDLGIMCGGYQGPLYPNPTTLTYPGFNPYQYVNPAPACYGPNIAYTGLGVGVPGIDYTNPGHVLGLLDTFGRMSYGLAMWQMIHAGSDIDGEISPLVNIQIPIISTTEEGATTLGLDDIYPSISEVPAAWTNSFEILQNGYVEPDPRPASLFVSVPVHYPAFTEIDEEKLNDLFGDKTVLSYFGMPQYLRAVTEVLSDAAAAMESKAELPFDLPDTDSAAFNGYSGESFWFQNLDPASPVDSSNEGKMWVECKSLSPERALKTLTGSNEYHNGADGMNEYRSLTELNAVINVMPVQMIGAQYWTDRTGYVGVYPPGGGYYTYVGPETGRDFTYASYMILDFVINVSDIPVDPDNPEPGEVTITGEATVKSPISDPTAYYYGESVTWYYAPLLCPPHDPVEVRDLQYGCSQSLKKTVRVAMSMKNKFGWDGVWLGGGQVVENDYTDETFEDNAINGGIVPGVGFITCDQSDLVVPFEHTFTLGVGCTAIRMRAYIQNRHKIGMEPGPLFNVLGPGPYSWAPSISYYINSSGPLGNPDSVPGDLVSPNIEVSFTATGTRMEPLSYQMAI
ncbi:MAG: hypothetical protein DRJ03_00395 [Chloroflexi bacterium]|nr:MAG: hypothetical protein DRJ03_00395 [Chloroflexota bacterium]